MGQDAKDDLDKNRVPAAPFQKRSGGSRAAWSAQAKVTFAIFAGTGALCVLRFWDYMPKSDPDTSARLMPTAPPPLATAISLVRVQPEQRAWRFYRMEVWPDLFGRALLMRHWGRIGTEGRRRLDPHPDAGAALAALHQLARAKRRRGYGDRAT